MKIMVMKKKKKRVRFIRHTLSGKDRHYGKSRTPQQIRSWLVGLLTWRRILPRFVFPSALHFRSFRDLLVSFISPCYHWNKLKFHIVSEKIDNFSKSCAWCKNKKTSLTNCRISLAEWSGSSSRRPKSCSRI